MAKTTYLNPPSLFNGQWRSIRALSSPLACDRRIALPRCDEATAGLLGQSASAGRLSRRNVFACPTGADGFQRSGHRATLAPWA